MGRFFSGNREKGAAELEWSLTKNDRRRRRKPDSQWLHLAAAIPVAVGVDLRSPIQRRALALILSTTTKPRERRIHCCGRFGGNSLNSMATVVLKSYQASIALPTALHCTALRCLSVPSHKLEWQKQRSAAMQSARQPFALTSQIFNQL